MKKSRKIKNEIVEALSELKTALQNGEKLSTKFRCKKIVLELHPQFSKEKIKEVRETLQVSQSLFAQFLGVDATSVSKWERGVSEPTGPVCRILDEILINPSYWKERLVKSISIHS